MKLLSAILLSVFSATVAAVPANLNLRGAGRALEDECAGEVGRAYGLCNAFCTAQDCDEALYDDNGNIIKSCAKIKENWVSATGLESLPCEAPPATTCPCWDGVPDYTAGFVPRSCSTIPGESTTAMGFDWLVAAERPVFKVSLTSGSESCQQLPNIGAPGGVGQSQITAEEAVVCSDLLKERCALDGFPV